MKHVFIVLLCLVPLMLFSETMYIHLANGTTAEYQLQDVQQITFSNVTSAEDWAEVIQKIPIRFLANYPNPFNPTTTIKFELNEPGKTEVTIFNLKGQVVRRLTDSILAKGIHEMIWDGKNDNNTLCGSGTYLYQVKSNNQIKAKKMLMLK